MAVFEYSLKYRITYREAYDTFYLLASRYGKQKRLILGTVLAVLSLILLVLFLLDKRMLFYLYLAFLSASLLLYLIYFPMIKARRGAAAVRKTDGEYFIKIGGNGIITFQNGSKLRFGDDKYSRYLENESVFAIRADSEHTICIPKRILGEAQCADIRGMLKERSRMDAQGRNS